MFVWHVLLLYQLSVFLYLAPLLLHCCMYCINWVLPVLFPLFFQKLDSKFFCFDLYYFLSLHMYTKIVDTHYLLKQHTGLKRLLRKSPLLMESAVEDEMLAKVLALMDQLEKELSKCEEAQSKEVHVKAMCIHYFCIHSLYTTANKSFIKYKFFTF